jgi:hypothetical protein
LKGKETGRSKSLYFSKKEKNETSIESGEKDVPAFMEADKDSAPIVSLT